jgi:hypothetical protein
MKKIVALFTAIAFALTLGAAFAEEKAPTTEKAPAKAHKAKRSKHVKKQKHETDLAAGTTTK